MFQLRLLEAVVSKEMRCQTQNISVLLSEINFRLECIFPLLYKLCLHFCILYVNFASCILYVYIAVYIFMFIIAVHFIIAI